jgi:hypothetical protein
MTTTWPDGRKIASLRAKLSSLDSEFTHWRAESEQGEELRKHNTQIRRVTAALDAIRLKIGKQLDDVEAAPGGADDRVADIETMILDVHRIWEFFRSKLSQRYVEWFRPFLTAADEFAWACYTPVRGAIDPAHVAPEDVREPPMVFLNGGWSPFEMSRGIAFDAEVVPDEEVPRRQYRAILDDLPFPVIGLPWYQVRSLPDTVLLGHEVGHTVEDDFHLTKRLETLLGAALKEGKVDVDRRDAWSAWLGETFADVYGTLAGGPAFTGALMDLVAGPAKQIARERADAANWGIYPPAWLRVHVALAALAESGFSPESDALRDRWLAMFPTHAMAPFEPDVEHVVRALIRSPMRELSGDKAIMDVISFTAIAPLAIQTCDRMFLDANPQTTDNRALLAAARFAFERSSAGYVSHDVEGRVLLKIRSSLDSKVRGGGAVDFGIPGLPSVPSGREAGVAAPGVIDLSDHDLDLGGRLFERLTTLRD